MSDHQWHSTTSVRSSNSMTQMNDNHGNSNNTSIIKSNNQQPSGPCYLKLLVSNVVAGSIIGQKGASIANMSSTTGCTIRLSHSSCYFPGTTERVVVMWGKLEQLKAAFSIILEKIRDAPPTDGIGATLKSASVSSDLGSSKITSKIVVPNSAVSQLIGKQGQTIKELQEQTRTKIQISNRDEHHFKERVVIISGIFDNVCKASLNVMETIQSDPHIKDHTEINYVLPPPLVLPQSVAPGLFPLMGGITSASNITSGNSVDTLIGQSAANSSITTTPTDLMRSMMQINPAAAAGYFPFFTQLGFTPNCSTTDSISQVPLLQSANARVPPGISSTTITTHLDVPDNFIGFVIGKQGTTLQVIQQQSGAKLHVSGKGEFVPGTENRRVTMSGSPPSVHLAQMLLQQKVREIEELTSQRGHQLLATAEALPLTSSTNRNENTNSRLLLNGTSTNPSGFASSGGMQVRK